jgi:nitric oxide reductase large subunit
MFKKQPRAISVSSDEIEISSGSVIPAKHAKGGNTASSSIATVDLREEEEESNSGSELENSGAELNDNNEVQPKMLEEEARSQEGNAAIDSIVVADEIAEWVETVLDDTALLHPSKLASLAANGLRKARKLQDFRTTILFAALTDFYHWMPQMG